MLLNTIYKSMKTDIHPQYNTEVQVTCACGNTFTVGSTKEAIEVEICAACHPFYTGQEKTVDTAGRLDKFRAKQEKAQSAKADAEKRASKKQAKKKEEKASEETTTEA